MKLVFLGNEIIPEDNLAKKVGRLLEEDFEIINIEDSFQLMSLLNENSENDIVLIDVVKGLNDVRLIGIEDLKNDSILSAHDFDAGYVLKLIGKNFRIIGIPMNGNIEEIREMVLRLVSEI